MNTKPSLLYHASPNKNISIFEPRAQSTRDPNEGPAIFATPDKALATTFLVPTNNSSALIGKINQTPYIVIKNKEDFLHHDTGGAIYTLPSDTFSFSSQKGMGENEWTSTVPVTPIKKEIVSSALETMIEHGVQVFFVHSDMFDTIQHSSDVFDMLQSLSSENQKRNNRSTTF